MNKQMNKQKAFSTCMFVLAFLAFAGSNAKAVNTIVHSELTSKGFILNSLGVVPSAGGITIGYFSTTAPNSTVIQGWSAGNAVTNLINSGWVDLRTVAGGTLPTSFDWDWPGSGSTAGVKVGGTLNWAYSGALAGKAVYLFAFNAGSSGTPYSSTVVQNTSSTFFTSSSFSGSTEWLAAKADTWILPSTDGTALNISAIDIDTVAEMIVGVDTVSGTTPAVLMIPEPSSASLLALGVAGLVALRIRRKI